MLCRKTLPSLLASCVFIAFLSGCGSSGSSGGGTTPPPPPPPPTPDFDISISPTTYNVQAGTKSPTISVAITAKNGFTSAVALTETLPAGMRCVGPYCNALITSAVSFELSLTRTVAPGSYTFTVTGTSGSLTHSASASLVVTAPASIPANSSAMVFTGDEFYPLYGIAYDRLHDQIFVSNGLLCEVDVVSPATHTIVKRIPVPSPADLDISPDGSTLYVGTSTRNIFEIDTAALQVKARDPFMGDLIGQAVFPTRVLAMSDGTLAVVGSCGLSNCSSEEMLYIYSPATGAQDAILTTPAGGTFGFTGLLTTSADRTKLFMGNVQSLTSALPEPVIEYDTATRAVSGIPIPGSASAVTMVVRPDGHGYAATDFKQVFFLDAKFNLLGTYKPTSEMDAVLFSPDSQRLLITNRTPNTPPTIEVADASSFKYLGQIPSEVSPGFGVHFSAWDGQERLLGLDANLLMMVDASMAPTALSSTYPLMQIGSGSPALSPDNSSYGLSTSMQGSDHTNVPDVFLNGVQATDVQYGVQSGGSNAITFTAPKLTNVTTVELKAVYPTGYFVVAPQAYSYQPSIWFTDQDAAPESGQSTIKVYGQGLSSASNQVSLSVGGTPATNVQFQPNGESPYPFTYQEVTATVPAHSAGNADIAVTTPLGTATLPVGFTYVKRTDLPLPAGASPFQMVVDSARQRILWTDDKANQLVVYSVASGKITQQIATGNEPAGLALTPDGSKLLLVLAGENRVCVYDASTLALLQQAASPGGATAALIVAVANQKAFLLQTSAGSGNLPVFEYDIASNSFTKRSDVTADQTAFEAASADGSTAFVASFVWAAATDKFYPALPNSEDDSPRALSADGAVLAKFRAVYGSDGSLNRVFGMPHLILSDLYSNALAMEAVNATGSLTYMVEVDRIRIFDVRHGKLIRTLMIPDGLSKIAVFGVAADPNGQALYAMTGNGLSTFTFVADPPSIGEVREAAGQWQVLGSGFAPGLAVKIDGAAVSASIQDSQHLTVPAPAASALPHSILLQLPTGETYSLDNAMDLSAGGVPAVLPHSAPGPIGGAAPPSTTASSPLQRLVRNAKR